MQHLHLVDDWLAADIVKEPIRKGFGRGLLEAGRRDERVVALCADLTESTQMHLFAQAYPERFVEVGIAEQNLATVGSGLAAMGKIPFISSYAAFSPGRNWEQIKTTIALNDRSVKVVGSHAGLFTGADGATHQMLEDIALMRVMPNMVVVAPADSQEAYKATLALAADRRPAYLRLARDSSPVFTTANTPFELARAYVLQSGVDISLVATGTMTYNALAAADKLFKDGIDAEVVHVPTIKPLDADTLIGSARKTGRVVVIEEAQIAAGLGGAVAELLSEHHPVPVHRLGIKDRYGESGQAAELLEAFGLSARHIALAAHHLVGSSRK